MEIVDEDPIWRQNLPGSQFYEEIGGIVVHSGDMMQFDPSGLVLKLAHLLAVCCHERAFARGLLHDLVDDQLRVVTNVESRSAELDGNARSINEGLVFCGVV